MRTIFNLFLASLGMMSCNRKDFDRLPARTQDNYYQMVVEIPAGSSLKSEYNPSAKQIEPDSVEGRIRIIDFLPYPGNYGFIPGTLMNTEMGGDGDPLDVLVIGPPAAKGTVIKILPIAILRMKDQGENDDKIIAIPADPDRRTLQADHFAILSTAYPIVMNILELWFKNYKKPENIEITGWGSETEAYAIIRKYEILKK